MYVDSLACVKVKGGESEHFRIDGGVRQGCIMPPWLFNIYMYAVKKGEDGDEKERREWRLSYPKITWFCVVSWRIISG